MAFGKYILTSAALIGLLLGHFAGTAGAQDLERGEDLFRLCTQCHGQDAGGMSMALAPAIAGMPDWYVMNELAAFRAGQRGNHAGDVGGMRMRPMSRSLRSEQDVKDVAAYVAQLPATEPMRLVEGDVEKGKATYSAVCVSCHAADGTGNKDLKFPPLLHTSDWYLKTQLLNYKAGVRGNDPTNTNGIVMRSMSNTLVDDQAIDDVVAYIMTLSE
jgi:cytochrome c oxidase subunit 2